LANPHDSLFKAAFRHAIHAASWAKWLLPEHVARQVEWDSLEPAPEVLCGSAFRLGTADLLFAAHDCEGRPLFVLIEHKSYPDPDLEEQLLRYAIQLRESGARDTVVLPLVCSHAPGPAPRRQTSGLGVRYAPRLAFEIDDLREATELDLLNRGLTPHATAALLCLAFLPGMEPTQAVAFFDRHAALLRTIDRSDRLPGGKALIATIGWYSLHVTELDPKEAHKTMERILQRPEDRITSTATRLRSEGHAEGHAEGQAAGAIAILMRLAERRFGPIPADVQTKIRDASLADVLRWTDRILDVDTLAELLQPPNG
jgi:hypothetical protein